MNEFFTVAHEVSLNAAAPASVVPVSGAGIVDWGINLTNDIYQLFKAVAVLVAVSIVVIAAIKSKGSVAAIVVAIFVGGLVIWAVNNPDVLGIELENDLPGASGGAVLNVAEHGPAALTQHVA